MGRKITVDLTNLNEELSSKLLSLLDLFGEAINITLLAPGHRKDAVSVKKQAERLGIPFNRIDVLDDLENPFTFDAERVKESNCEIFITASPTLHLVVSNARMISLLLR